MSGADVAGGLSGGANETLDGRAVPGLYVVTKELHAIMNLLSCVSWSVCGGSDYPSYFYLFPFFFKMVLFIIALFLLLLMILTHKSHWFYYCLPLPLRDYLTPYVPHTSNMLAVLCHSATSICSGLCARAVKRESDASYLHLYVKKARLLHHGHHHGV